MDQSKAQLFKSTAEACLAELNNGFHLKEADETEEKLVFENDAVSFFIAYSGSDDSSDWVNFTSF